MENKIPIENIYYLLCYAWGYLNEKDIVNVDTISKKDLPNLFADILAKSLEKLIKMGFDREYIEEIEEIPRIRGKINFQESIKRFSFNNCKAICEYDNLSHDILQNQIIKTTIYNLITSKLIKKEIEDKLVKVYRYFGNINAINLENKIFNKVKIHRNNSFYGFIINICEFIHQNVIVDEKEGKKKFRDFHKDERRMAYVFENFVRNFYKKEQNKYSVSREDIYWKFNVIIEGDKGYLPKMQTDITLENNSDKIIIDTKYYKNALNINYNREKFKSDNLYQLYSYLENVRNNSNKKLTGILVYPEIDKEVNFSGKFGAFEMRVKTVNLNSKWENIHNRLIEIIL